MPAVLSDAKALLMGEIIEDLLTVHDTRQLSVALRIASPARDAAVEGVACFNETLEITLPWEFKDPYVNLLII